MSTKPTLPKTIHFLTEVTDKEGQEEVISIGAVPVPALVITSEEFLQSNSI
jgi:hypothetical protein